MDDSAITCDEIVESYDEKQILMKINQSVKRKISVFYLNIC